MENRRQKDQNIDRPPSRTPYQRNPTDRSFGERKFQSRDDGYQRRDTLPQRENRNQNDISNQPRSDRFQPRDTRFQGKADRFQNRDSRFQGKDNRFQGRDNRFPPRDTRLQGKPSNFDPKKRFPAKFKVEDSWKQEVKPKVYSEMQVTEGKLRGKFFKSTTSPKVRPTTRRLREAMFKFIFRRVRGRRFLDICAGSGAVGIEAISQGALLATFVERSPKMCSFIRQNMASMEIKEGHGEIFEIEAIPFLMRMEKRKRQWDVVFLDPPYDANYDELLDFFGRGVCLRPRGMLVIEHHAEMFFPEALGVLKRWRVAVDGESALTFYERV